MQEQKQEFIVSVIIPVYNAERFVERAVSSALEQPETGEVILIEDGSPDNCLTICKELEKKHSKVRLLQHPKGKNKGAGASRNLGIINAKFDYIAFLDADDYYLPERFKATKGVFEKQADADGVYEAIGVDWDTEELKQKWLQEKRPLLTTITEALQPEELFENMAPIGTKGWFSGDGLTIKKNIFKKTGLFDTYLKLSQDTHMWMKMAAVANLYPGNVKNPVSMRGSHQNNRINNKKLFYKYQPYLFLRFIKWGLKNRIAKIKIIQVRNHHINQLIINKNGYFLLERFKLKILTKGINLKLINYNK